MTVWKSVVFKPCEIKAVGYCKDTISVTHVRKTPWPPVALKIIPDDTLLAEGGDMTRVVVVVVDRYGQTVPAASTRLTVVCDPQAPLRRKVLGQ